MEEEPVNLDEICNTGDNIFEKFQLFIETNDVEKMTLFLNNIKKIIVTNKLFDKDETSRRDESCDSLFYACKENNFDVALVLINSNVANLGFTNVDGYTSLMECAGCDEPLSYIVASELLKGDCKPEHTNYAGRNALMQCCRYRTNPSIEIAILLLDVNIEEHQFHIDDDGNSGLDYLLTFVYGENVVDYTEEFYVSNKEFVELVIKYLKLYHTRNPDDQIFIRNLQKICNSQILRQTFSKLLQSEMGITLFDFCSKSTPAEGSSYLEGKMVQTRDLQNSDDLVETSEVALEVPLGVAEEEIREGVSPGGRWVSEEEYNRVGTLPKPNFPEARREERGGKKITKKKMSKRSRKTKKNKK